MSEQFDLGQYIADNTEELTQDIEVRPGCNWTIRYVSLQDYEALRDKLVQEGPKGANEIMGQDHLLEVAVSAVVAWRGMTPDNVARLINVRKGGLPAELPFNRANVKAVLKHSRKRVLIAEAIADLEAFRDAQERQAGNSSGGGPAGD